MLLLDAAFLGGRAARRDQAAGFVFDGKSNILANPNDPHTAGPFDKSIQGHTDQFIFRFRKPQI